MVNIGTVAKVYSLTLSETALARSLIAISWSDLKSHTPRNDTVPRATGM